MERLQSTVVDLEKILNYFCTYLMNTIQFSSSIEYGYNSKVTNFVSSLRKKLAIFRTL